MNIYYITVCPKTTDLQEEDNCTFVRTTRVKRDENSEESQKSCESTHKPKHSNNLSINPCTLFYKPSGLLLGPIPTKNKGRAGISHCYLNPSITLMDIEPDHLHDSPVEEQSQPLSNESDEEELVIPRKKQKVDKGRAVPISCHNQALGANSTQLKLTLSSPRQVCIPVPTLEQIEESEEINIGPITLPTSQKPLNDPLKYYSYSFSLKEGRQRLMDNTGQPAPSTPTLYIGNIDPLKKEEIVNAVRGMLQEKCAGPTVSAENRSYASFSLSPDIQEEELHSSCKGRRKSPI